MEEIIKKISSKEYVDLFEAIAKEAYPIQYEKLIRYDDVDTLERIKHIGLFCGMEYVGIEKIKPGDFYSKDDHSRVCAFIALYATGSLNKLLQQDFMIVEPILFHI